MPEANWGTHSRWLTAALINSDDPDFDVPAFCEKFIKAGIEVRRLWKPMHLQPLYRKETYVGNMFDEKLFKHGICLPSSSNMTSAEQEEVMAFLETMLK